MCRYLKTVESIQHVFMWFTQVGHSYIGCHNGLSSSFAPGWSPYLCSLRVAWISHTRTKDLRFFSSVQMSDMCKLPMLWASSLSREAWNGNSKVTSTSLCDDYYNKDCN